MIRYLPLAALLILPACQSEKRSAYEWCQNEVKKQLRAPSAASFPEIGDSELSIIDLGSGTYSIHGHVDAPNAFGVPLRGRFSCDLGKSPTGEWQSRGVSVLPAS